MLDPLTELSPPVDSAICCNGRLRPCHSPEGIQYCRVYNICYHIFSRSALYCSKCRLKPHHCDSTCPTMCACCSSPAARLFGGCIRHNRATRPLPITLRSLASALMTMYAYTATIQPMKTFAFLESRKEHLQSLDMAKISTLVSGAGFERFMLNMCICCL